MSKTKLYRKSGLVNMRPYVPGEDLSGVSVHPDDKLEEGGMIAINTQDPNDRWYVSKKYFEDNYELFEF